MRRRTGFTVCNAYLLQEAKLTLRETQLILAASAGAEAVEAMLQCAKWTLGDDITASMARTAWGCALDALGWRENGHGRR